MAKSHEKNKARALRRRGMSIKKIAKKIEVSAASVSIWCRDIELTDEQIKRLESDNVKGGYVGRMKGALMHKQKKIDTINRYQLSGLVDIGKLSKRDLFLFGLGIYAGEGYKYGNKSGIANSDPGIIVATMKWFKEICSVPFDDIRCQVGINRVHSYRVQEVESYWSKVTGVPLSNFMKTSLKNVENKKIYENSENYFGTLSIRILKSSQLEYRILGWLRAALG